jgi:hypothetical protein
MIQEKDGLFTDQACSNGEAVAPEDVVSYLEGATTKPML